ncbi:hypothetical protein HYG89_04720 [Acinetobacter sp. SwsAc5]|uniref:hypothetical protein n=1 Tax=Acinetobacter sp. SwsAc5 TaxID=2749438 RepID=UPI0015BD0811|nr:hypothetical protein [Acinetobacter sp. SwsAc5]NWK51868.1 hypothetical protein [Acinetobacter sp. SwsAc5]
MIVQNNPEIAFDLLTESPICAGRYRPSEEFKKGHSLGITINGEPILMLGYAEDQENHDIADRLLACEGFKKLVKTVFGTHEGLEKGVIINQLACPDPEYLCLTESEQGVVETGIGTGLLVAVLPQDRQDFAFGLCAMNDVMLCLYPNAKPLSKQIILSESYC